ncbi:hypothetical protein [Yoonia sp.]|uniref:hypothetical protein n=1 Tax=Yoonia sp. TaxID=2212373 RepID=UPI0025D38888|nr:hypothetical protein [Yoonia sp.]
MTLVEEPRGHRVRARLRYYQNCARQHIPPGLRSIAGLGFVALGIVGFLPVAGFWMIPVGLALIWLDLGPVIRSVMRRIKPGSTSVNKSEKKETR